MQYTPRTPPALLWITAALTGEIAWYDSKMKERLYYIVGVSLLVLLVLVVYVGSRVQNVEVGLASLDSRLSTIEAQLDLANTTGYYDPSSADQYGASAYDTLMGGDAYDSSYYVPYDYTTQ